MAKWANFEKKVEQYLNDNWKTQGISFRVSGGSDSTQSDIEVTKNGSLLFYMEIKMSMAQSGQFVVKDNGRQFVFSPKNKSVETQETQILIDFLNQRYAHYRDVGTAPMPIHLNQKIFTQWIVQHYKQKKVKYVVTEYHDDLLIFPVEKYGEYFNITANLRKKKSGSASLSRRWADIIQKMVSKQDEKAYIQYQGEKAYLHTLLSLGDRYKFTIEEKTFQLNWISPCKYEVRQLSSTNNPNVIFTITTKQPQQKSDFLSFQQELRRVCDI